MTAYRGRKAPHCTCARVSGFVAIDGGCVTVSTVLLVHQKRLTRGFPTMAYADWREEYEGAAQDRPELQARLWNLENETRVSRSRGNFKRRLGQLHRQEQAQGSWPNESAESAMNRAIEELGDPNNTMLGKLQFDADSPPQSTVLTHVSALDVSRYYTTSVVDPDDPPRQVQLHAPQTREVNGTRVPHRRFVWVTWPPQGDALPDNATALKRELGLAHYQEGDHVYRCPLEVDADRHTLFVPTCLDAGLYAAWKPPPVDSADSGGLPAI